MEQQREALGDLPDRVLSEQGQRHPEQGQRHLDSSSNQSLRTEVINIAANTQAQVTTSQFKCDGRQHCSQMNSRAEAEWFVQHCPDNKMDGDGDKIPCENDSRW